MCVCVVSNYKRNVSTYDSTCWPPVGAWFSKIFVWRCDVKFETVAFVLSAAKWNEKSNFNKQGINNELKSHFCRMQSSLNRTTNEKENFIFEIMKIDSNDWHCRDSDDYVSSRPTEYGTQQWKLTREESSFPSFRPKLFLNMLNL